LYNLLLGIRGYVELAQQHAGDARIERWLGNAIKVADEGSELMRRLLAFGRKEEQAPDVLDVNALVDDTRHLLERLLGSRISIVTRLEREPCRTRIERARMNQVLVNLAVNARDAMPDGGTLTIETRHVVVDDAYLADHLDAKPGPHVALAVSDTGTGMPQATVARIFEPFYTTKERGRGTGLGLSTVYGIVTQSGGHVTVSSELGKGTRFEVLLPADGSPVAGAPAGSSASVTSAA
jgi:signal transduction histidine kinase